jgi:O-antigen/teichoic acid export membrane protein
MTTSSPTPHAPRSLLWVGLEAVSLSAVSFAVLAALARSLSPEVFGHAALALSVVQIAASVLEGLFLDAIVQRKDLGPREVAAAHALTALLALVSAAAIAAWAALSPGARDSTSAAGLMWLMAPSVVFTGVYAVPLASLRRALALREVAMLCALARIAAGLVAVGLMAAGAGTWGLVAHQNLSALLLVLALQWRGHRVLRGWGAIGPSKVLLRFALMNSLNGLLTTNRSRLFQLMCSMVMPARVVGQLSLALRLVEMLAAMVVTGVARLALVRLAALAHSGRGTAVHFLAMTRQFSAFATPVFVLMAALAAPLVQLVGDHGWAEAASLVAWFALAQALRSPVHLGATLLAAHGRPQLNVVIVSAELLALAALVATLRDPLAWVWRLALVLPLSFWCMKQVAGVAALPLLKAVQGSFVASLGMWLLVRGLLPALHDAALPTLATLVVAAGVGAAAYTALLALTWRGAWTEMRAFARL